MGASKRDGRRNGGKGWLSATVLGIGLASLFSDLGHEAVTSVLPAYLAGMGAAAGALGTVEGFADGLSCVAKLYGGWLADRLRRRKPLCASGYGVMALSPLVIASAASWPMVAAGRTLAWVSRGIRKPARKALLAEAAPEAYGRVFGLERAMDTCGAVLAPLGVLLLLRVGWTRGRIILLSALPILAAALAIWFLVREKPRKRPTPHPFLGSFKGFDAGFKGFLAAVGLFGLGDFAVSFYILYAVYALSPRLGPQSAAAWSVALYAVHNVFCAGMSYAGGWLSDRVPKSRLLPVGYLLVAAAAACMAAGVSGLPGLAAVFILGGLGVGLYEAVEDALAAGMLPPERRGRGFGALAVTAGVGDWFSSLCIGWLWAGCGAGVAFGGAAGLMLAGAVLMAAQGFSRFRTSR